MRVLIVDDHPIVRMGLVRLIERTWPNAAIDEGATVAEARARLEAASPSIITLDLQLPDAQGTEALSGLLRSAQGAPILVLSQGNEATHSQRVMQMGAAGYLSKHRAAAELVHAIRSILRGERYVSPELATHLLSLLDGTASKALPHEALTPQEHRVMQLIASGNRASQIASTMHLSVKTVANYRARILAKTGWRNNIDLAKYCLHHGLTNIE